MTEFDSRLTLKHNPQPQLPGGLYLAEVERMGRQDSQYGTPMVNWRWRLVGSPKEGKPYTYLWRVTITEDDINKLTQIHRALGLATPSLPRLKSGEDVLYPDDYLGRKALIELEPEWYTPPGKDKAVRRSSIKAVYSRRGIIGYRAVLQKEETL